MRRAVILILLLAAGPAPAQGPDSDIPRLPDGRPDLNGIWQALNTANWNLETHAASQGPVETLGAIGAVIPGAGVVAGGTIPYTEEALATRRENHANRRTEDPEAKCFMPGVPRITYMPHPFRIFQGDGDIFIAYQFAGAVRTVFMGDNQDLVVPVKSWMGWSTGHWEGDTLVVEVTNQHANWLDRSGNHVSENRTVTERYTPITPYHLRYEATIEDPDVLEEPLTISMPLYRRMEDNAQLYEFKCQEFAEEMMYGHLSRQSEASEEDSSDDTEE